MAEHTVELKANPGIFEGLAKQNMKFHQCMAELIDNAIAAPRGDMKFNIQVFMNKRDDDSEIVDVYVADNCGGMELEIFKDALQLGKSATTESRLNEHGFGLKNALATLSGDNGFWEIWTSPDGQEVYSAEGPFDTEMSVEDDSEFPQEEFLPTDLSTVVHVPVKLSFVQTVQGRGAPAKDLQKLRQWLIEHLGVLYRGYLQQNPATGEEEGIIYVAIQNNRVRVPPVEVPLGNSETKYFEVELGGEVYRLEYEFGTLDEVQRDRLVKGEGAQFYYQGNQPKQGIDIRLGKRVIATCQMESVWKTEDEEERISRHNKFNDFLGELKIPELPRGILTTTNNKTDFNMDDPDWQKIFETLNQDEFRPIDDVRKKTESSLRNDWIEKIEATNPEDTVTDEKNIWPTGTRIDVYRESSDGKVTIYEIKTGTGSPQDLYQLKMYWDGLVIHGEQPNEAILLVEDYSRDLEEMANKVNDEIDPPSGNDYNFSLAKHSDKGLE